MRVRAVLWGVGGAVVTGVVTGVMGILGVTAGSSGLSVGLSVAGRAVLTLVGLAMVVLLLARRGPFEWVVPVLVVAAAGFVLDPLTWTIGAGAGGPLFGVPLTGSGPAGLAVDLVVWLLVAGGVGLLGLGSREDARG